jgi:hypothetical protein
MKPFLKFLSLVLVVFSFSCSSTKKITTEQTTTKKWIEHEEVSAVKSAITIDTSKTSDTEITYTKIEYFAPISNEYDSTMTGIKSDSLEISSTPKSSRKSGNIKSIETYTVRKKSESKAEIKVEKTEEKQVHEDIKETADTDKKEIEKTRPSRIKYVFYILILLVVLAFVYRFRSPIINILKLILKR